MFQKTFFGCFDFRNAKFQGSIRQGQTDGIGIMLDNQLFIALSNWKGQTPDGPSLVVYPNRDYFYGNIRRKKLTDIVSYVRSSGEALYFNFVNGVEQSIAYIDSNQIITELSLENGRLKVIKTYNYHSNQQTKFKIIGDILKVPIKEQFRNYRSYAKNVIEREFYDVVEVSENSGQTFIGFRNTVTLGIKFDKNDRIREVGNFQQFPRDLEFGRRYTELFRNKVKIEQGKFTAPEKIYDISEKRSIEAVKITQEYFKRGTNFKNNFIKLSFFEDLSQYFGNIIKEIEHSRILEFGQKILQKKQQQQDQYYENKTYSVKEVKKQIYDAINRRNQGKRITDRDSPLKKSREKIYQPTPFHIVSQYQINQPSKEMSHSKSKSRYKYTQQVKGEVMKYNDLTEKRKVYENKYYPTPDISDFDRRILKDYDFLEADRIAYLKQRQQNINYEPPYYRLDKTRKQYLAPPINRSKSPFQSSNRYDQRQELFNKIQSPQSLSKYQNYLKYKNRNKLKQEQPEAERFQSPKKYNIFPRKVLSNLNVTPEKQPLKAQLDKISEESKQQSIIPNKEHIFVGRYKKNYKYL